MDIRATATFTPRNDLGQFIASRIMPGVVDATIDAGLVVLLEAQELCPVDTGRLRASGHVEVTQTDKTAIANVIFDAPYAAYVEFGTGRRGAASSGAGPYPYDPNWPGMRAQAFLRPALDGAKDEMIGEFALRFRY
jgi:HK97 gp10 family phage protein